MKHNSCVYTMSWNNRQLPMQQEPQEIQGQGSCPRIGGGCSQTQLWGTTERGESSGPALLPADHQGPWLVMRALCASTRPRTQASEKLGASGQDHQPSQSHLGPDDSHTAASYLLPFLQVSLRPSKISHMLAAYF